MDTRLCGLYHPTQCLSVSPSMYRSKEGHQVVFAQGEHVDAFHNDHVVMVLVKHTMADSSCRGREVGEWGRGCDEQMRWRGGMNK